jgi:hypothetical protein
MEKYVHRTQMPLLPAKINKGIIPEWKKGLHRAKHETATAC